MTTNGQSILNSLFFYYTIFEYLQNNLSLYVNLLISLDNFEIFAGFLVHYLALIWWENNF